MNFNLMVQILYFNLITISSAICVLYDFKFFGYLVFRELKKKPSLKCYGQSDIDHHRNKAQKTDQQGDAIF